MCRAAFVRKMKLPEVLEFWRFPDDIPRRRRTTLVRAVIHDGKARRNGGEKSRTVAL